MPSVNSPHVVRGLFATLFGVMHGKFRTFSDTSPVALLASLSSLPATSNVLSILSALLTTRVSVSLSGAKMLRNVADTYFNDDKLDPLNKTLMVFASYNAGPNRIAHLRKQAVTEGLDPEKWFGNVELVAAKEIGQETVQYVSNIYKYYVAYKLTLAQSQTPK